MTDLSNDDRLAISAVVHQNYYMPDVFAVVEGVVSEALAAREAELREQIADQIGAMHLDTVTEQQDNFVAAAARIARGDQ